MAFRNFVVAGGAKEVKFIPKDPKDISFGVGSPSISVNNNDVDVSPPKPLAVLPPIKPLNTEETPQLVEDVGDSDDTPSGSDQLRIVGSSGIADRVRTRKGTSAKAAKTVPKRKPNVPTPSSRNVKQKTEKARGKAIMYAPERMVDEDDIPGK